MNIQRSLWIGLAMSCPTLGACGASAETDSTYGADETDVGDPPISVPDPGDSPSNWLAEGQHVTPQTAWAVGVVTDQPGYIEGTAAEDGSAFYVFEAGATKDINVALDIEPTVRLAKTPPRRA
ncbi:MAG: hypothetical protein ACI9MC_002092 [Kiritimatiellia bacterium]|jgi:hypothetical protein